MSKISAAILTWNRREAVLKAIQSVVDQGFKDVEIVVVDSASTDGTGAAVREKFPQARLIRLPRNLGCPGGRNHVFANCTGDYIVSVDDDGFLGEGALEQVAATFDADPDIGVIAMRQKFVDEPDDVAGKTMSDTDSEVSNFSGGVSAFRRSMLDKIGYYPEHFFLYAEETDLALRAMNAGFKIVSRPNIIMWHPRVGSSAGTRWDYYRFRNPLLVVIRNFPGWLMVKYLLLRLVSYALLSLKRGTPHKYLAAVGFVLGAMPGILKNRKPVRADVVDKYFRLRGKGAWGQG